MPGFVNHTARILAAGLLVFSWGCSLIDEDRSDCGADVRLDYELQLVTNRDAELQAQLGRPEDAALSAALRQYLDAVFTDIGHDITLSFYDLEPDDTRRLQEQHIMDAAQASYTLYLPVQEYLHQAVANLQDNGPVQLRNDEYGHMAALVQEPSDTTLTQRTGLFTGLLPLEVLREVGARQFDVKLHMVNCATALVLDTTGVNVKDVRVFASGFATHYFLADGYYAFTQGCIMRPSRVNFSEKDGKRLCFATVNFPSHEPDGTRSVTETEEPFRSEGGEESLWQLTVYVELADGSVTRSILDVFKPVRPGQLKIILAHLREDGSATTGDPSVGVSVTTQWNQGFHQNIPL